MRSLNNYYFFLWVILIISSSCSKRVDKDLSLTRQEYLALGVPDYDNIWTQDDYIDAFTILNKLKLTKPSSLPKKDSKKSGKLFERIISDENFAFLLVDTLSLSEKAYQIQYYSSIQNELVRLYTIVLNKDQYYYQELIEIYIFGLNVTQKKLDLANKIMKSEAGEDKKMQYGLYSVQLGYMEMVLYVLENHNISTSYSKKDHEHLSKKVVESVMKNKDWMKPKDAEILKQKFQMVIDNTTSEATRENYRELLETW